MAAIVYLKPEQLEEHPDNPRKSIGDITELCASIQKQGLLQNLTVVPHPGHPGKWRIVIGHRRFNAAKAAGLSELPCVIDDKMSYAEQIAVMMSENMQRNDLTINERVGGVQMMMDLGIDIKGISESTGLSQTSVRRYAKLAKIQSGIDKAEQQGATLMQLAEIAEIEFPDLQAEALKNAGTGEYIRVMFKVKERRLKNEREPIMRGTLLAFAEESGKVNYSSDTWIRCYRYQDEKAIDELKAFKPKDGEKYIFKDVGYGLELYSKGKTQKRTEEEEAQRAARAIIKQRCAKEEAIARGFREMRKLFMAHVNLKDRVEEAHRFILWILTRRRYLYAPQKEMVLDAVYLSHRAELPEDVYDKMTVSTDEVAAWPAKNILHAALVAAYDRFEDMTYRAIDTYTGKAKSASSLEDIRGLYRMLEGLGYEPCAEEKEWLAGTHPVFSWKPEGDADKKEDA